MAMSISSTSQKYSTFLIKKVVVIQHMYIKRETLVFFHVIYLHSHIPNNAEITYKHTRRTPIITIQIISIRIKI